MTPENEQGVIVLFAQQAQAAGFEIVSIGGAFPDALVTKDGVEYRAEFEYRAANFKSHKHDVRNCDLVVCWVNDWPGCILPVLALSEFGWPDTDLSLPGELERRAVYWELRALSAEARLRLVGEGKTKVSRARSNGRSQAIDKLLTFYADHPDAMHSEAADVIGRSRSWVTGALSDLEAAGIIDRNGQGVTLCKR